MQRHVEPCLEVRSPGELIPPFGKLDQTESLGLFEVDYCWLLLEVVIDDPPYLVPFLVGVEHKLCDVDWMVIREGLRIRHNIGD